MNEERPKSNGNALRDYRILKTEELLEKHDDRIKIIEDFVTREGAGGFSMKQVLAVAAVVGTILGGILTAVFKFVGII